MGLLDALDSILGAISYFDMITPAARTVTHISKGKHFTFKIPHQAGFGIYTVKKYLEQAGCDPYGLEIFNDEMIIAVSQEHAWAGYQALRARGVPMDNDAPPGRW